MLAKLLWDWMFLLTTYSKQSSDQHFAFRN